MSTLGQYLDSANAMAPMGGSPAPLTPPATQNEGTNVGIYSSGTPSMGGMGVGAGGGQATNPGSPGADRKPTGGLEKMAGQALIALLA